MPPVLSSFAVRASTTGCVALSTFFALLVVGPSLLRCRDAALRTSRQQYHEPFAVFTEVNPVSWSEIDPEFLGPCPDTLHIGKVAKLNARQRDRHLRGGLSIGTADVQLWYHGVLDARFRGHDGRAVSPPPPPVLVGHTPPRRAARRALSS